jgi:3-hydroxyisobutyrate dehydrogenase-like beta-hydroxyacid dehydrogenase
MLHPDLRVGVIGLGAIGGNVARVLHGAGFAVVGYDVSHTKLEQAAPFIIPAASPAEVSAETDVVLVAVFDEQQVRDVLAGEQSILQARPPAPVVAILSTIGLRGVRWANAVAASHEVGVLDCMVTGGPQLAERGTIVVFAGGDEALLESIRPVLEAFAEPLLRMGPSGAGAQAKLARNVICYGTWCAAWEGARLAQACGLDVNRFVEAVRTSERGTGGTMGLLAEYAIGPGPVDRDDASKTELAQQLCRVARKDLRAAIELGAEHGITLRGAALDVDRFSEVVGLSLRPTADGSTSAAR